MLIELYIKNLAVIEKLHLQFCSGLTMFSGDEGVGKSLIVDALCLLLGERGSSNLIRSGAESALVEGIFEIAPNSGLETVLQEAGLDIESDGSLILTRELQAQGRNIARVNGRAVSVSLIHELGRRLIDIHKQTENISILDRQRQIDLLDSFGGLVECRNHLGKKIAELRDNMSELDNITSKDAERRRDLLEYQVAEIERAEIEPGEEETLQQEEHILQRIEALRESCSIAYNKTYFDGQCATGLLHQAAKALRSAVNIDPALGRYLEALESASVEVEEVARDIRRYTDNLDVGSERLVQVEGRLRLLRELKNKYGGTLEEVIEFASRARHEMEAFQSLDDRKQQLEEEVRSLEGEAGELAQKLSDGRQQASQSLIELVNGELAELGLPWAEFGISLRQEEDENGLDVLGKRYSYNQDGIDRVEFLGTTNPGVPLMPLAEIASGGETCRFMLSLKSALQQVDQVPTLVFDEIDSGVGGRGAGVVGKKLLALAQNRQVIAITHLPQIACFGHCHYHVAKEISNSRAFTRVGRVEGESRVQELAAMLGSGSNYNMRETAQELISQAAAH